MSLRAQLWTMIAGLSVALAILVVLRHWLPGTPEHLKTVIERNAGVPK